MNFMYLPTNRQAERLIGDVEFEERNSAEGREAIVPAIPFAACVLVKSK